jgi:DNA-binding LacI/PurR family transcriptional regulator
VNDSIDRNSSVPLHKQIQDILQLEIQTGCFENGCLPGEFDLAKRFRVSRGTVRQAMRSLEQLHLLRREPGRGTFTIPPVGLDSTSAHQTTISLVVPHFQGSYLSKLLLGVDAAVQEIGAHLNFSHAGQSPAQQSQALLDARAYGVSGIILLPVDANYQDETLLSLTEERFPIVLVDRYVTGLAIDYVTSDGYGGMLRAVQHLLALGHQYIGFVGYDLKRTGQYSRYLGYQQAMQEWGIQYNPDHVIELKGDIDEGSASLEAFLANPDRPTALVAWNDYLAVKIMNLCRKQGIHIPKDLALIGFDDVDFVDQLDIPLTTVTQPVYEIGYQAGKLLFEKIAGRSRGNQRLILPTQLAIRESCGAGLANCVQN